jgi:hypothetical protein
VAEVEDELAPNISTIIRYVIGGPGLPGRRQKNLNTDWSSGRMRTYKNILLISMLTAYGFPEMK